MPTPSGWIVRDDSNTRTGTPIWWQVSAMASPAIPPPATMMGSAMSDPLEVSGHLPVGHRGIMGCEFRPKVMGVMVDDEIAKEPSGCR